jgi:hypothetical protein
MIQERILASPFAGVLQINLQDTIKKADAADKSLHYKVKCCTQFIQEIYL